MAVVQLHSADVGLQSVHGLVLLLVQNSEEEEETHEDKRNRSRNQDDYPTVVLKPTTLFVF